MFYSSSANTIYDFYILGQEILPPVGSDKKVNGEIKPYIREFDGKTSIKQAAIKKPEDVRKIV